MIRRTPDTVTSELNLILGELTKWCRNNLLTPHPDKTEFMLYNMVACRELDSATQLSQVASTRCLAEEIESDFRWTKHVSEFSKTFIQKLNLL